MTLDELVTAAKAWRDQDPDPITRDEVDRILGDVDALRDRFGSHLTFGTAGLRGQLGAGPNRMNRAVVIRTTSGLAAYLDDAGHGAAPVVVGYDARHRSGDFATDAASVLAAAGHPVHLTDRPVPTPVLAFAVRHLGCCAGIQITASHNPATDNGYKVYLSDGVQIAPPTDQEIAERIAAVGSPAAVPRTDLDDPRIGLVGGDLIDAYVHAVTDQDLVGSGRDQDGLRIVYTPLHGVGDDVLRQVFQRAGFAEPRAVPQQADPDPNFPTVAFPNPEEPGALDLALEMARAERADLVLANDPDADRLAVAVPDLGGSWRVLTGDEVGVLLADWLLSHGRGDDRMVVTTVVSSSMLSRLAAARRVHFAETLTGFKWIARAAFDQPSLRFVYGYEEALGYCIGDTIRDKDGISAALAFTHLVAAERSRGRSVLDRLDDLAHELGVHATGQRSFRLEGPDGLHRMITLIDRLVSHPPAELAGRPLQTTEDLRRGERLPPADGVILRAEGVRLVVRPSGTEPKLKCYAEAVVPVTGDDLRAALSTANQLVERLLAEQADADHPED